MRYLFYIRFTRCTRFEFHVFNLCFTSFSTKCRFMKNKYSILFFRFRWSSLSSTTLCSQFLLFLPYNSVAEKFVIIFFFNTKHWCWATTAEEKCENFLACDALVGSILVCGVSRVRFVQKMRQLILKNTSKLNEHKKMYIVYACHRTMKIMRCD